MNCVVAFATRARQYLWCVDLEAGATVADALAAARQAAALAGEGGAIPWAQAPVGIFGVPCARTDSVSAGDRIELYRPLLRDPRERRRERARGERRAPARPR